jgi:hypothetical protein
MITTTFTISNQDQERQISKLYLKDRLAQEVRKNLIKYSSFERQDNRLLLYKELIYVVN